MFRGNGNQGIHDPFLKIIIGEAYELIPLVNHPHINYPPKSKRMFKGINLYKAQFLLQMWNSDLWSRVLNTEGGKRL